MDDELADSNDDGASDEVEEAKMGEASQEDDEEDEADDPADEDIETNIHDKRDAAI